MVVAASASEDDDGFPRPFAHYVLLENFARGGMGEVYLAKYGEIIEKYCVLKKLRKELTRDREYVTRFIDEARVVVTLNHANICHVFDVGRVGDEYYLAMEYVSGRDVRTMMDRALKKERPIPAPVALQLTCETLEALDYAHRREHPMTKEALNLVHRDVSPQNVLVSYEGEVKLIDFGLAASKLKVERTQPNVVMGKMAYMAPEQARGDPIDARADLFACGVLCYELLSGERFYEGMTANDIWNVAGKGGFMPRAWEKIDPEVAKILAKALNGDPKKRFATCGDFRQELASHMHWRFPGSGVKGLRDVMSELFAEEIAREREMLARFGKVTVASFRQELESTQSHSVSLAASSASNSAERSAQLVRNEQSSSGGALMPPPARGSRDVHVEPTRIGALDGATSSSPKGVSTDEQTSATAKSVSAKGRSTNEASALPAREATARVVRTSTAHEEPTALVRDRERVHAATQIVRDRGATLLDFSPEEQTALGGNKRTARLVGGAVLVLAAFAVAFVVARGGDDKDAVVHTGPVPPAPIDARAPADATPAQILPAEPPPADTKRGAKADATEGGGAAIAAAVADAGAPIAAAPADAGSASAVATASNPVVASESGAEPVSASSTAAAPPDGAAAVHDGGARTESGGSRAGRRKDGRRTVAKAPPEPKVELRAQPDVKPAEKAEVPPQKSTMSETTLTRFVGKVVNAKVECSKNVGALATKYGNEKTDANRKAVEAAVKECGRRFNITP